MALCPMSPTWRPVGARGGKSGDDTPNPAELRWPLGEGGGS